MSCRRRVEPAPYLIQEHPRKKKMDSRLRGNDRLPRRTVTGRGLPRAFGAGLTSLLSSPNGLVGDPYFSWIPAYAGMTEVDWIYLYYSFNRFRITLIMISFSDGLLAAIMSVNATSALSSMRLLPSLQNKTPFF